MSWRYRVVEDVDGGFSVREVYHEEGEPTRVARHPIVLRHRTRADLHRVLAKFMLALQRPTLKQEGD